MFDEWRWYWRWDLEDVAWREEQLAKERGGHHVALARMVRKALTGFGPRTQLSLFPGSVKPKTRR